MSKFWTPANGSKLFLQALPQLFLKAGQLSAPMHQLIRKISILLYFSYIVSRIYYAPPACVWVSHPLSTCGQSVHHFHPRWHNVNSGTALQSNHSEDFSSGPTRPTVSTSSLGYFAKPVRHLDKFSDLFLPSGGYVFAEVCLFVWLSTEEFNKN